MRCRSSTRWVLAGLCVVASLAGTGCRSDGDDNQVATKVVVEEGTADQIMTPTELSRRFKEVYTEGLSLARAGHYAEAFGAFEQALKLRPGSVEALFNLGACYEAIGDPLQAISIYRRVQVMTPDDPDCYANLGTSFIKMYHRERSPAWRKLAREAWDRSLELKPDQPDIRAYLASTESID